MNDLQNIPNCFYRISPKALILNETHDKFLIIQEDNGKWDFPGGGLDFGETVVECLTREIKEEMGLEVVSISEDPSYFFTGQFENKERKGLWYANVFFETKVKNLEIVPSSECVAVRFVSPEEVADLHVFSSVTTLAKMFKVNM
jgi:8-oxo-dGTP pyrophosphatase MutT (NUDIX family)